METTFHGSACFINTIIDPRRGPRSSFIIPLLMPLILQRFFVAHHLRTCRTLEASHRLRTWRNSHKSLVCHEYAKYVAAIGALEQESRTSMVERVDGVFNLTQLHPPLDLTRSNGTYARTMTASRWQNSCDRTRFSRGECYVLRGGEK